MEILDLLVMQEREDCFREHIYLGASLHLHLWLLSEPNTGKHSTVQVSYDDCVCFRFLCPYIQMSLLVRQVEADT